GAAALGSGTMLGRIGGTTIALYLVTTFVAVCLALLLGQIVNPGVGLDLGAIAQFEVKPAESTTLADTILNIIPANVVNAMSTGAMLQIIVAALILGYVIGSLGEKVRTVQQFFTEFNTIMMRMVLFVFAFAPLGVFCLTAHTFANTGLAALVPLAKYASGTLLALALQLALVYSLLLVLIARLNPQRFFRKMLPVLGFAFSTSSSNATIPLTMETLERKIGVSPRITSFTIPLGATINMDGTAIMQGMAVVFTAQAFGVSLEFSDYLTVILTATMASIGTAGVPGVGLITLSMVFASVNLPMEGIAMIMGIDRLIDMTRTAVNVTGDAVVTCCVAQRNGLLDRTILDADEAKRSEAPIRAHNTQP
ncbi:MAG: dicarboxylate/amino acid:cation symporter, partial [Rhodocyclaceae bacterium]|nr:dicarboxylate/amino acid:cation symporter [Rhodocyclaceae bacterium]